MDVDGIRTSYFEAGAGEDMVLIHGVHFGSPTSSAIAWTANFPLPAAHFHVHAVDKLGMGFTDNPASDADYSLRASLTTFTVSYRERESKRSILSASPEGGV